MRVWVFLVLAGWLCWVFPAGAVSVWEPSPGFVPEDARNFFPNDMSPPERREPRQHLVSLPAEQEGTIRKVKTTEKFVALTFDLCELATVTTGYDADVIDFLRQERIPATLFLGGKWMRTHHERTKQLIADPLFELGNHAWSHGNFGIMSEQAMREQVRWTRAQYELLREAVAQQAAAEGREVALQEALTLFRLPYGRCSEAALKLLAQEGVQVIQWSVVAELPGDNTAPGVAKNVLGQIHPGDILLFHANRVPKGSGVLLREVVHTLHQRGYRFVTVSDLLTRGEPQRTRNGYFNKPGDNTAYDGHFGIDGTGRKR